MNPLMLTGLMTLLLLALMALGMPVAFTLITIGSFGIVLLFDWQTLLYSLGTFPISYMGTFLWTIIPLFILMGNLAQASGVASDAYDMANKWLGRMPGGLAVVTLGACGIIAATTASGATGTVVMGKIAVPEMKKYGYDMRLATGATAAGGTVGILIPPSGPLIYLGILAGLSIGKLFAAGILPGILSVLIYIAMVVIRSMIDPKLAPRGESFSWKERLISLRKGWGVLLLFGAIMGGLYTGIATPTEVAAVGVLVALVMTFMAMARRKSNWAMLKYAVADTIGLSAMVFALILGAAIFSLFLAMAGIVPVLVEFVTALAVPRMVILLIILASYIPLGMFLNSAAMILLTVPVFFPIVVGGLGFDGIWFSILIIKLSELGGITPPVGAGLFIMHGVYPEASLEDITRGCLWFMLMDVLTIAILIAFPLISTWLPSIIKF